METLPLISTTLLNWNRADLLKTTLTSYVKTITVPHELFVIDNHSTDGSRDVIREFCAEQPVVTAVLLEDNLGGEAVNLGLERSRAPFLHISENDLEYLPGWSDAVLDLFETFPELGQLSLFGPVPTDEEAWDVKPCALRHRRGRIIYVTEHNVSTSCILRREVWDSGVRVHNLPTQEGQFLFPDDGRLSIETRAAGYWVAWAPHYLVRNLGHRGDEIITRSAYYLENYRSKSWFGLPGLAERLVRWTSQPHPIRRSFLFGDQDLSGEISEPHAECANPQLWSMIDGKTAEIETLEFLYGLTRLLKPGIVVETGTWHGHMTVAIAKALRQNGFGKLIAFEIDTDACEIARKRISAEGLTPYAEVRSQSSLEAEIEASIDLLVLDSALTVRAAEFRRLSPLLSPNAFIIFHDTSVTHEVVRQDVQQLAGEGLVSAIMIPSPRGLAVCQCRGR